MFCYRITKYNPYYRNENGAYQFDEWTSVGDVGKIFDKKVLTYATYLAYENAYIDAILYFFKLNKVKSLKIKGLELHFDEEFDKNYIKNFKKIKLVTVENLTEISILNLREMIWCKFCSNSMYVHFGYDYYMYIGSKKKIDIDRISHDKLLFYEEFESPYK